MNIQLTVQSADELFESDVPMGSKYLGRSPVMNVVLDTLMKETPSDELLTLKIHINSTDARKDDVAAAIKRYCANKIEANEVQIALTKREGRRYFMFALPTILITAVILSCLYYTFTSGEELSGFALLIAQMIVLLGWVILWWPMEDLVYAWRPWKRENDAYRRIANATMQIT